MQAAVEIALSSTSTLHLLMPKSGRRRHCTSPFRWSFRSNTSLI